MKTAAIFLTVALSGAPSEAVIADIQKQISEQCSETCYLLKIADWQRVELLVHELQKEVNTLRYELHQQRLKDSRRSVCT